MIVCSHLLPPTPDRPVAHAMAIIFYSEAKDNSKLYLGIALIRNTASSAPILSKRHPDGNNLQVHGERTA
jgi:hypothetical protein